MAAPNAVAATEKKKSPVSFPMICALLIVIGAAIYLNLPNQNATSSTAAKKRATTTTAVMVADANGITAADYKAHFPRYPGSERNPYVPGILSASQQNASAAGLSATTGIAGKAGGSWTLTGVNVIDGVTSALVESSSGDSATLHKGDQWHGLRVASISDQAVTLTNALGQTTQLSFDSGTASTGSANPDAPAVPSLNQIRPLPPLTVSTTTATPSATTATSFRASFRSRRRSSANTDTTGNDQNNNQNNGDDGGSPDGGPPDGGPGGGGPGGGFGGPPPD